MKRYRRLRRLQADADLVLRRAGGETLRELAVAYGVSHTTLSRYFARPDVARQLRQAGQLVRAERRAARTQLLAGQKVERQAGRLVRRQLARERAAPGRAQPDQTSQLASAPAHPNRSPPRTATNQPAQPELVDRHAAATAALCYVEQLEAAYQHAFAAIETLISAIERVQQLRDQQRVWDQAQTLGVAPKRPEPLHVRAAFNPELAQLQHRFNHAHNSNW
jgi:hypothetical protein